MGQNSNRSDNKDERITKYATEVLRTRDTSSWDFQTTTGAKIRGEMGVEKGNAFIKAMNEAKR